MPMNKSDLVVALVLTAFGALVVAESWRMPRFENIGGTIARAPGLVPGLLGAVLVLFGIVMAVRAVATRPSPAPSGPPVDEGENEGVNEGANEDDDVPAAPAEPPAAGRARLAWMFVLSLLYAGFLVGRVNFAVATFLFVITSIVVFERPSYRSGRVAMIRIAIATVIALAVAWAVPYVFERIFLVNLP